MTWFVTSANETETAKEHYHMFLAADFDFPSGHVYLWSGTGELSIGGNTYLGMGELVRVSVAPERSNLTVDRKTYQLTGVPVDPAVVSETDIDGSFGRSVTEYLGFLNAETRQLLATPEVNFEGEISNIRRVDGREPLIEVNADNRLIMLDQADGWRYTHEHQQQFYAGDLGYNQVPSLDLKEVLWGGRRVVAGGGGSRGGGRARTQQL
jgi:hypothetical protein